MDTDDDDNGPISPTAEILKLLYSILLKPIEKDLEDATSTLACKRVVIIPDGPIFFVPFSG